ncbi:MAG: sporulation integral membrane protein YtvI [Firmicutes bacterium]|nr:sporulation integral membrane protein YtvI [Bacillota bacterium]
MHRADKETLIRYLLIAAIVLLSLACFCLFFGLVVGQIEQVLRYVGILISPFLIAWLVAAISRPFNRWLIQKLHLRPSGAVMVTISGILLLLSGVILLVIMAITGLLNGVIENAHTINRLLTMGSEYLNEIFVYIDLNPMRVEQYLDQLQLKLGEWATEGLGLIFNIAKGTPAAVIWFIVTLVAVFYWCRDEKSVVYHFCRIFPKSMRQKVEGTYDKISNILGGYIRAQALLVFIAAAICTVGMALCGVKNPLLMGVFAGVLDVIPVVGPGVVLIGWFIWALIMGDYGMAIGLSIVYVVVIVSREILNPKLVGDGVGIHPLLALAGIFIGMKMFGLVGVILGPLVAAIVLMTLRGLNSSENRKKAAVSAEKNT